METDEKQLAQKEGSSDGEVKYDDKGRRYIFYDDEQGVPERDTWGKGIDFVFACVGFAVGLGNVWRFPYLCYKNGGGAFLIPYVICLLAGGVPIFFMEISMGQFMGRGGHGAWRITPVLHGIGVATTVITFLMNIYYIIILAWDGYYFTQAFQDPLPWSHCNNEWNTPSCFGSFGTINCSMVENVTDPDLCIPENVTKTVDPVEEYWDYKLLKISGGVDEVGEVVWELALSLLVIWIIVYFCVWKGVKWTGKVVYFTASFPYVILTILLVRGVTLEGAANGLEYYFKPDFERLKDAQVWVDGGTQIFFSYAIALGAMEALGSYNKFNHNCYRDCIIIASINSFTSLYAGLVVFSVLGFMAHEQGVPIDEVATKGPGLAFIAYPKAVTQMPIPQLWAVLFFLMVILVGLDSQFVGVEAIITVIMDLFPSLRKGFRREIVIALYCGISFLVGLTMVTEGGMYVFQLFDYYSASGAPLLWVCFFEAIAVAYVYGANRFYDDMEMMLGFRMNYWFQICWRFLTPVVIAAIFIFMWVKWEPLTYGDSYEYPDYAQALGLCMSFVSMICIPICVVIKFLTAKGDTLKEKWEDITTPRYTRRVVEGLGLDGTSKNIKEKEKESYKGAYENSAF